MNTSVWDSCFCLKLCRNTFLWYKKTFAVDTGKWCLLLIFREVMEIFLQSQALLLYNGTSNSLLISGTEVHLANEPKFIKLFASFLALNCVTCCLLWLLYAFKPSFCHGVLFELILSATDAICDIFYALFPLIVVFTDNSSLLVALGSLQTDSLLSFLATFIPMILLLNKCWSLLKKSKQAMYDHYMSQLTITNTSIQMTNTSKSGIITATKPSVSIMHQVSWIVSTRKINAKMNFKDYMLHPISKKIYVALLSILFASYGIIVLSIVTVHFNDAILHCNKAVIYKYNFALNASYDSTVQNLILEHPELLYWDDCYYKVYPFDNTCDCRNFRHNFYADMWNKPSDFKQNFNVSLDEIPMHIFKNWRMLEKFNWGYVNELYATDNDLIDKNPKPLNFTKDMFIANQLRIFQIAHQRVGYIDDAISNWKKLEYFSLTQIGYHILPTTFSELTNLKYFAFGEMPVTQFPNICSLKLLEAIFIESTALSCVPHCIADMKNLQTVVFGRSPNLKYFPLELLVLPNLKEIDVEDTAIYLQDMMDYNNISNFEEFDQLFSSFNFENGRNASLRFDFANSKFCDEYHDNSTNFPLKFQDFIETTDCCSFPCNKKDSFADHVLCLSHQWGNGVCDGGSCNNVYCGWENGDCLQLCHCADTEEKIKLLGNGVCNPECNTTACEYDEYDCVTFNYSLCAKSYGTEHFCKVSWISDGFCDANCRDVAKCHYDGNDCNFGCWHSFKCDDVSTIFKYAARIISNDDFISLDEACTVWSAIQGQQESAGKILFNNCSHFMSMDRNNDAVINLYETLIGTRDIYGVTLEKALQLDCSMCIGSPQDYNGYYVSSEKENVDIHIITNDQQTNLETCPLS